MKFVVIISLVGTNSFENSVTFDIKTAAFLNDLFPFSENSDWSNCTDWSTSYSSSSNLEQKQTLRRDIQLVAKWFDETFMVLESGNCQLLCLGKDMENKKIFYDNTWVKKVN